MSGPCSRHAPENGHKGDYGHVLVIGGAAGKTGAAAMAGLAGVTRRGGPGDGGCSSPTSPRCP